MADQQSPETDNVADPDPEPEAEAEDGFGDEDTFGDEDDEGWGEDEGDWGDLEEADAVTATLGIQPEVESKSAAPDLQRFTFGERAFKELIRADPPAQSGSLLTKNQVFKLLKDSVKGVETMRGQRGQHSVSEMLYRIYGSGLFTFGGPHVPVNRTVIPALRFVFAKAAEMDSTDPKRVGMLSTLARACQDCQQVQAREIMRVYGDLTNQTETFDSQIEYVLLKQKEDALNSFITQYHERCDEDHTQVKPSQQRAHLTSAYIDMLGKDFGLEGIEAARSDRFLSETQRELNTTIWGGVGKPTILLMLKKFLKVDVFVNALLSDINNQSPNADRLINRDIIFKWVQKHFDGERAHDVFYNEERAEEFSDQNPSCPTPENQYQPFLSRSVLVDILGKMGFLAKK